jgi:hypothetical protein
MMMDLAALAFLALPCLGDVNCTNSCSRLTVSVVYIFPSMDFFRGLAMVKWRRLSSQELLINANKSLFVFQDFCFRCLRAIKSWIGCINGAQSSFHVIADCCR